MKLESTILLWHKQESKLLLKCISYKYLPHYLKKVTLAKPILYGTKVAIQRTTVSYSSVVRGDAPFHWQDCSTQCLELVIFGAMFRVSNIVRNSDHTYFCDHLLQHVVCTFVTCGCCCCCTVNIFKK